MSDPTTTRFALRDLPLPARLTLAVFLCCVGVGYCSALVQLHFQHAQPGAALPTADDARRIFNGQTDRPISKMEVLLKAEEGKSFNGTGSMAAAFTRRSEGWSRAIREHGEKRNAKKEQLTEEELRIAEAELRRQRDGERLALLDWIEKGADMGHYERDAHPLPASLVDQPFTPEYLGGAGSASCFVKIKSILTDRCVRCHAKEGGNAEAMKFPLECFEELKPYVVAQPTTAMSLTKLAQTSHVHLLGFSMLYGLTGLVLAFSSYPSMLRVLLCPLPLLAQVVDISFWWLARLPAPLGSDIAGLIPISGGIVAVGLLLHIVLSLFDLFGGKGKFVLVLLLGTVAGGGYLVHRGGYVQAYLQHEKAGFHAPAP